MTLHVDGQMVLALLVFLPCLSFVTYVAAFLSMDSSRQWVTGVLGGVAFASLVAWMLIIVAVVFSYVQAIP